MRGGSLGTEGTRHFIQLAILAAAFELFDETVDTSDFPRDIDLLRTFDCADAASDTSVRLSQSWNCSIVADKVGPSVLSVLVIFLVVIDETFINALVVVSEY